MLITPEIIELYKHNAYLDKLKGQYWGNLIKYEFYRKVYNETWNKTRVWSLIEAGSEENIKEVTND